jgi:hypothetical protein
MTSKNRESQCCPPLTEKMSRMSGLNIVIPVFNESNWIESDFEKLWSFLHKLTPPEQKKIEIFFCIWQGSQDASVTADALTRIAKSLPVTSEIILGGAGTPSVVASLQLSAEHTHKLSHTLICPCDCAPTKLGLLEALSYSENQTKQQSTKKQTTWAVFPKKYTGRGWMPFSAHLQNTLLAPVLGLHCWTNLFVIPAGTLKDHFSRLQFLEDLAGNVSLKKEFGRPHRFLNKALVSSRRYEKRGHIRQMIWNCRIFLSYLAGRHGFQIENLRHKHEGTSATPKPSIRGLTK